MRFHKLFARRPTPALVISTLALFVSLGGVGYAAISLPNNSVGPNQIRNGAVVNSKLDALSVGSTKIQFSAVGTRRINHNQVQARVNGTCSGATGAIGAMDSSGNVTCNSTLPKEYGTGNTVAVPSALTNVASVGLPPGSSYLALANPTATVSSTGPSERVTVSCTLTVGANTQTRSATVGTGAAGTNSDVSLPLMVAGPSGSADLACQSSTTGTTTPSVGVTSSINAIQTASNS